MCNGCPGRYPEKGVKMSTTRPSCHEFTHCANQEMHCLSPVFFYFDLVSPYAYLASNYIDPIAKKYGRQVQWKPFRIGVAVVKVMGLKPAMDTPLKNDYIRTDVSRLAKVLGLPITSNLEMFDPIPAQRLIHGAGTEHRAGLCKALLKARWADNLDLTNPTILTHVAETVGVSPITVQEALRKPETRLAVRQATDAAILDGVFGSPTCRVEEELFWGVDRLWLLEHYLAHGENYSGIDGIHLTKLS